MRTEEEARREILELVASYTDTYLKKPPFKSGDRIPYASRVFDSEEVVNLVDSALDFWLTAGKNADCFEKDLAGYLSVRYCSFVNSGSSANLLAFMALCSPLLEERRIRPGDEVIAVAAGFPTTVTPIIQSGAVPVFVDVTIPEYNIDTDAIKEALSEKTKAVMLAHTLGNPFDLERVSKFCEENSLWLIEDNCDALGSKYVLNGEERYTGTIGDIGTSSFYPPHHLTTGEGGAVYTDDALLHKIVLSMRDWGRDCVCPSGVDNMCGKRFGGEYGELPKGYDHKYVYSHFGYNLKATDLQAAIGLAQLKKLPAFTEARRRNFSRLHERLSSLEDKLILPTCEENAVPSWFGFLITLKEEGRRDALTCCLEAQGIQTRLLFAGNLIKHPCFDGIRDDASRYRVVGDLENTNRIMRDSFWIGVYPGMTEEMIDFMADAIKGFFKGAL